MNRFYACQSIGYLSRPNSVGNAPNVWKKWPYCVLIGPSGQLVQLNPPSGFVGKIPTPDNVAAFHAIETTLNHSCIAWQKNRLAMIFSNSLQDPSTMRCYAWNPQPQEASKINPTANVSIDDNTNVKNIVVADGSHWELWNTFSNRRDFAVLYPIMDGIFWVKKDDELATHFGIYKGKIPYKLSTSGYFWASAGNYGNQGDSGDEGWSRLPGANGAGGFDAVQDGISFRLPGSYPSNLSFNLCEIVKHNDTFYTIAQNFVQAMTLGCKGNYIHHDNGIDSMVAVGSITGYEQRSSNNVIGASMRSATIHKDKVWMLTNEGKVFEIRPGGLIETADLTEIGTQWASGIFGGQMDETLTTGNWPGSSNFRPLLRSFNNQLHAFLNFRSSFRVAKGKGTNTAKTQGHGICWFTSHDGTNWSDRTEMLPASGIQTPSGNAVFLNNWLAEINPYRHSAYMNTSYPSGYGPKSPLTNHLGESAPLSQGALGHPSGFKQSGFLPFWSSGNLLDNPDTPFSLLKAPLEYGTLSGCLVPTLVAYPSGYAFVSTAGFGTSGYLPQASGGIWEPILGGASGWDYTGCSNYHVGGHTEEDDPQNPVLKLYFSRNFIGNITNNRQVPTLFFDLTKSSGFIQKNEAWNAGQLNGFTPINIYNPEISIPSGDFYNTNPSIDVINKLVKIDYVAMDWFYWENIKIKVQYSLDGGQSWADASTSGSLTGISTGSNLTDPSGVGTHSSQLHSIYWKYSENLSKNEYYPNVSIRIRGEL